MWEAAQQQKTDEEQKVTGMGNTMGSNMGKPQATPSRKQSVLEDRDAKLNALRRRQQQAVLEKAGTFRGSAAAEPKMDEREKEDCELILGWTSKYFDIVRNTVEDTVPKAIFEELINPVKVIQCLI